MSKSKNSCIVPIIVFLGLSLLTNSLECLHGDGFFTREEDCLYLIDKKRDRTIVFYVEDMVGNLVACQNLIRYFEFNVAIDV